MSFNPEQFRELVQDTLRALEPEIPYSVAAVELLMLTAAVESNLGEYIQQYKGGPARGVFQQEPFSAHDLYCNWLVHKEKLLMKVKQFETVGNHWEIESRGNIVSQIVWARLHYRRIRAPLPEVRYIRSSNDKLMTDKSVTDLAKYWKKYYNTPKGRGTVPKAIAKYRRYAL